MATQDCNIFEIWEEYKTSLLSFIKKRVQDTQDAEDILQEVLLKSYQFCIKGKTILSIKAWLYKVTQNTVIDYYKNKSKQQNLDIPISDEIADADMTGEASEYIKVLLRLLPQEYAEPLFLHDLQNIAQKEIAARLNLSLPNTKSRILRGRMKLKERFLECCAVEFNATGEMVSFDIKPHCTLLQDEKKRLEKTS